MTQDYTDHFMSKIAAERERIISRRGMLGKTAVAGGAAALAVAAFPTFHSASAQAMFEPDPMFMADVDVLNYALTLEHLESVFYSQALDMFTADDMGGQNVFDRITEISAHEDAHVEALTAAVSGLMGEPVMEGKYDFGYTDFASFLTTASAIENVGVGAYAGAAPSLVALTMDPNLVVTALGIHSVEARHAGYVTELIGDAATSPFPEAVDPASAPAEVLKNVTPFITA